MRSSELISNSDIPGISAETTTLAERFSDHVNRGPLTSHGNITVLDEPVFDNNSTPFDSSPDSPLGNKVGTVTLVVKSNGYEYKIPASTSPYGVPQLAVIGTPSPTEAFSAAPEGQPQPSVSIVIAYTSSRPAIISWETYVDGAWETINSNYFYYNNAKSGSDPGHAYKPSQALYAFTGGTSTVSSGAMTYTTSAYNGVDTAQTSTLTLAFTSNNATGKIWLGQVRMKVDSTAQGGGVRYSAVIQCYLEDQTGSWFCTAALPLNIFTPFELRQLNLLRNWARQNNSESLAIYSGELGKTLISKMSQEELTALARHIKQYVLGQRNPPMQFLFYTKLVKDCFRRIWPDCPDKRVQQHLIGG